MVARMDQPYAAERMRNIEHRMRTVISGSLLPPRTMFPWSLWGRLQPFHGPALTSEARRSIRALLRPMVPFLRMKQQADAVIHEEASYQI